MSCDEIRELFSDHLDGALPPEAEDRLGRHVQECRSCREALTRYEAGVGALAGQSPALPRELGERLTRRLESEGLLAHTRRSGVRSWLPSAALLAVFAGGLLLGRLSIPRSDRFGTEPPLTGMAWADACSAAPVTLPALDPRSWRAPPNPEGGRVVLAGAHTIRLPRRITSHGPYDPDVSAAVERAGSTCLPLAAPLGARLALNVTPAATAWTGSDGVFVVEVDPQRVFYARVLWHQTGLIWSLEGRADASELLDVAREIAARTRVESAENGQTL